MCKGDGNCLPRAISHLCFGTEDRHREICCRMVIDALKNISNHLNNEKLYTSAIKRLPNMDIRNFYAYIVSAYDIVQPEEINEDTLLQIYQEEVKRIIKLKKWMSMWHIHGVSNAVGIPSELSIQCSTCGTEITLTDSCTLWKRKITAVTSLSCGHQLMM